MPDSEGRPTKLIELPEHTLEFLRGLDEYEVGEIQDAMRFMRSIKTVSKFFKWLIITIAALFLSSVALGEAFIKMRAWFAGVVR